MSRRSAAKPARHEPREALPARRRPRKRDWIAAAIAVMVVAALVFSALTPFLLY